METKTEKTPEEIEKEETEKNAEADAKLNAAVASHVKRALKPYESAFASLKTLDQTIASAVAKGLEGRVEETPGKKGEKVDPQSKLALEEVEKLKRSLAEEKAKREEIEEKTRWASAREQLKGFADSKGIKGFRQTALISHLIASGAIVKNEDGEFVFNVTRSRAKGATPEALAFDIAAGFDDWCKTTEAQEFLPAPGADGNAGNRRAAPGTAPIVPPLRRGAPRYQKEAQNDHEAARRTVEQLEASGVNVNAILNE